jgi:hypothetical protein
MKILLRWLAFSCCLLLASIAPQTAVAVEMDRESFAAIDAQLREGNWEAAREASLAKIGERRKTLLASYLVGAVARLAVAEAGMGREEDAIWHWHIAQNLDRAENPAAELATFGKAGELLTRHPLRRADEPAGLVKPGRKLAGDMPKLSADIGLVPAPKGLKVQVVIDAEGRIREPVVVSGAVPGMIWEVLEALRGWRYEPARRGEEAVAVFRELTLNSPAGKPLPELAALSGKAAEVESLLRAQKWREAEKRARKVWSDELHDKEPKRDRLAAAMALRALAEAGAGRADKAICHWQAAQHLDERLYDADLTPYGTAGEILGSHRWGAARAESRGEIVKSDPRFPFTYPAKTRRLNLKGMIVLTGVIDEQGALHQPAIVRVLGDHPTDREEFESSTAAVPMDSRRLLAISILDSFCDRSFEPAVAGGKPVAYQEMIAVPFDTFSGSSTFSLVRDGRSGNSQGPHAHPGGDPPSGPRRSPSSPP